MAIEALKINCALVDYDLNDGKGEEFVSYLSKVTSSSRVSLYRQTREEIIKKQAAWELPTIFETTGSSEVYP